MAQAIKRITRIIQVESSQFSDRSYWMPGMDYWVEDVKVIYLPSYDDLEDEELLELADNEKVGEVNYVPPLI